MISATVQDRVNYVIQTQVTTWWTQRNKNCKDGLQYVNIIFLYKNKEAYVHTA